MTDDFGTEGQVGRHGTAVVNGPEGDDLDWLSIDWQRVEDDVQRLRRRIYTASRALLQARDPRACLSPVR